MAAFNLVDERFIPCQQAKGVQLLSLQEALLSAGNIAEIRDQSPLVTAALYRFLTVVLHRSLNGPKSLKKWKELWDARTFPAVEVERYLKKWKHRFDLFDERYPFFQAGYDPSAEIHGTHKLPIERSGTHCKKHFSHTDPDSRPPMPPDEAARQLIAHQAFAPAGGSGYQSARTANTVVTLLQGENLFQTLCLNLNRYPDDSVIAQFEGEAPVWERDVEIDDDTQIPGGYTDYMTWSFRLINLRANADNFVTGLTYSSGRWLEMPESVVLIDPMVCYVKSKDVTKRDQPVRFDPKKSVWRELGTLLSFAENGIKPSKNVEHVRKIVASDLLPKNYPVRLIAFGYFVKPEAKVNFWRNETLPLPLDYLSDADLVVMLRKAIAIAEEVGKDLRSAVAKLAELTLSGDPNKSVDQKRLWQMVDAVGADALYWSRLERPFREFLVALPGARAHQQEQLHAWFHQLRKTATKAFREAAELQQLDARGQRAAIEAESRLHLALGKIRKTHNIPKQEEVAT